MYFPRTMIGHCIQRRARTPAVALAGWDICRPDPTCARTSIRDDCVRRAIESHEVAHEEAAVPDHDEEVRQRRGDC